MQHRVPRPKGAARAYDEIRANRAARALQETISGSNGVDFCKMLRNWYPGTPTEALARALEDLMRAENIEEDLDVTKAFVLANEKVKQ